MIKNDIMEILESAIFSFSQDGNCIDGENHAEFLEIRCESSLGIDRDNDCFFILKTEGWSIDSVDDLQKLIDRIKLLIDKDKV